jgi:hypothetical protein
MIIPKNIEIIRDSQFKPVSSKQDFQDGQEGFLKIDRMNKICRMDRITLYNFRQDEQDLQDGQDNPL